MKKTILWSVIVITSFLMIVMFALSSCKESEVVVDETVTEEKIDDGKFVIGISNEGPTNDWAKSLNYHIQYSFDIKYKDLIEKVYYESCEGDPNIQVNQIENLLTKDIDALLVSPLSESALVTVIEKATDMKVSVIVLGSSVLTDKYVTYVDRDNYETGKTIATWICEQLGGKGKIVTIMGEPGSGYSEDVLRGVSDALKEFPDIDNLGTEYGEYSPVVTKQKMEAFLASHPDIGGVIVDGGMMGMGIIEAFTDAGLELPYLTVDDWNGFHIMAEEIGYNKYVSVPGGSELAADACDLLIKILNGESVPKEVLLAPSIMSGDEVRAMIPEGMPESYWALCKIPAEHVKEYYE